MPLKNTESGYGAIAKLFHWLVALVMVGLLAVGLYMTSLGLADPQRYELTQVHKAVGFLVFIVIVARLLWRLTNRSPALPTGMNFVERLLAQGTHLVLYALMIVLPLSGWISASASTFFPNDAGQVFGLFPIPDLIAGGSESIEATALTIHDIAGKVLLVALFLHVAGALKHHIVSKDDVLRRMLPGKHV